MMLRNGTPSKDLIHPKTLEPGQAYLLLSDDKAAPMVVTLIKYDPCPAFVIVRLPSGERVRCGRDSVRIGK